MVFLARAALRTLRFGFWVLYKLCEASVASCAGVALCSGSGEFLAPSDGAVFSRVTSTDRGPSTGLASPAFAGCGVSGACGSAYIAFCVLCFVWESCARRLLHRAQACPFVLGRVSFSLILTARISFISFTGMCIRGLPVAIQRAIAYSNTLALPGGTLWGDITGSPCCIHSEWPGSPFGLAKLQTAYEML